MGPTLISGDGMDLIHNHRLGAGERLTTSFGGEQNIERLRRGDQDMRWPAYHRLPFASGGIAGTHRGANLWQLQSCLCGSLHDLAERLLQVFLDVVAEGLEGRDIDDMDAVGKGTCDTKAHQAIDRPEKG